MYCWFEERKTSLPEHDFIRIVIQVETVAVGGGMSDDIVIFVGTNELHSTDAIACPFTGGYRQIKAVASYWPHHNRPRKSLYNLI